MSERSQLIDNLRGFSILVMILTHTTVFFPNDTVATTFWNWSNFAVPIFIFCSTYLFLKKSFDKPLDFFSYLKKRFTRLLIPYYTFLFFFLLTLLVVNPQIVTDKYVWQSILVIGGVDINWLVLLFLYITILLPFFAWSFKKARFVFWSFFAISFASTVLFLFHGIELSYKYTMWLPWALMLYVTFFYIQYENKKKALLLLFFISVASFIASYIVLSQMHQSVVLTHNKYPPNLFYLSYGVSVLLLLSFVDKYLFANKFVLKIIHFFSKFSYSIYFLHYILLTIFATYIKQLHLNWWVLFLSVLCTTACLQIIYNRIKQKQL